VVEDQLDQFHDIIRLLFVELVEALEIGKGDQGEAGFSQVSDPDQGQFPEQLSGRSPIIGGDGYEIEPGKVFLQAE